MSYKYSYPDNYKYLNAFIVSDLVDLPIHIIDSEGTIIFVNKAWSKTYNYKREEAVGKNIQELMSSFFRYFVRIDVEETNKLYEKKGETFNYKQFDEISDISTSIRVLKEHKKVSMVTSAPDDHKVLVTSTPIFNYKNEIEFVYTLVQNLTKISDFNDRLEAEVQKNIILSEELKFFKEKEFQSKLIGKSKKMNEIKKLLPVVAKTDATVLILGESGVGKEILAKEIYLHSERNEKPFITINCAAIPENLLESEMFGYEKGAFTGAVKSKEGLFELANGGTILLDEIGAMPLSLQPKLLRVLQENEFMRVGGTKRISLDVRVIAATNEKLLNQVKSGSFRQDLYYRLNVVPIIIPPLRERKEDIKLLAYKFINEFNDKYGKNKILNEHALFFLEQYEWPGNVRELKNAIERLIIIGEKDIITANQVQYITNPDEVENSESLDLEDNVSLKEAVQAYERKLIKDALIKYKTTYKAAEALKTTQPTIVRKAKQLKIEKNWDD